jgi:hypothetical protein
VHGDLPDETTAVALQQSQAGRNGPRSSWRFIAHAVGRLLHRDRVVALTRCDVVARPNGCSLPARRRGGRVVEYSILGFGVKGLADARLNLWLVWMGIAMWREVETLK